MPPKGGIRKRLGLDDAQPSNPTPSTSASASSHDFGGSSVRRRVGLSGASSSASSSAVNPVDGPLVKTIKRKWAKGRLSSVEVEEIFRSATAQGAEDLPQMSSSNHPQNLQRSLLAAFGQPVGSPKIVWKTIPTSMGDVPHPFILPHSFFSALHTEKRAFWNRTVRGPVGAAARFWKNMEGTAFHVHHPGLAEVDPNRLIPLGLHGDAGAYSHQESLFVFTWNSLLGEGSTLSTRFLMTVLNKSQIVEGTLEAIESLLAWSFNVALTGVDPAVDERGRALPSNNSYLAGGWKGVLTKVRGDWEFFFSVFKIPNWNNVDRMCFLCLAMGAENHRLRYSRTDAGAPWRGTRVTHESFLAYVETHGLTLSGWFKWVLGLRVECLMIDVLHCVDLGVFAHVLGNIFFECMSLNIWGTNIDDNVKGLEVAMKAHYKTHKTKNLFPKKLKAEHIRTSGGWPKFKAKAAVVRSLAKFSVELAVAHLSRRHVLLCQMMVRFYELLESEPMFLSAAAKEEIALLGSRFCDLYSHLAGESFDAGMRMWKGSPKLHLFQHLCEWQAPEYGNPRFFWTYADEDMIGQMCKVAESCHPRTMSTTALWKWLVAVFEQCED